jgi:hypothetical protein
MMTVQLNMLWRTITAILLLCVFITSCSKEELLTEGTEADVNPHFTWDITVELEQPNNWSVTVFSEKVAITNIAEGKQYMLTWKGGLSTGKKSDAILKTIVRGEQTKTTELDILEVKDSGNNIYELFLRGGGRKGEIVFTK